MASTDKSKVKITESSKQANVDITSETIVLPADSADQVLVAKVPSAANCTSGVNVEVEMSPDGTNWCPALRKEVVTTAGSSTAAIIGNEKYVDLQKKAPVYNSYGKGRLNFDINGNTVQSDSLGTGARDSLDQHIAVNKSFNYSMWVNSSTQPTSTYKPVLFRHGGKDDFENTKVVSLTSGTAGATTPVNTRTALGTVNNGNTPTNYDFHLGGTSSTLPGFLPDQAGYQSYTNRMPSLMEAWSISCWVKIGNTGDTLGTSDYVSIWSFGSGVGKFQLFTYAGHLRATISQSNGEALIECATQRTAGQWYHCVVTKSAGTGSVGAGNQTDQGELKLYIDGTLHATLSIGTSLSDNNFYTQTINSTYISGPRYFNNGNYRSTGLIEIDDFSSYNTDLNSDEISALRNGTKAVDPTTIPVSGNKNIPAKISTYFRFGDASNDNVTGVQTYNQIDNAYRTANNRSTISTDPGTTTIESYNSRGTFNLMTSSDTLYNASSSTGISKSTQNLAQRIAYSNTSVVQSGEIKSTGYQARVGDPYQDWTVIHWSTPYKADNTTPINAQAGQSTICYGPTAQWKNADNLKRWACDNSVYIGGQNSRLQVTNGWYGIAGNHVSGSPSQSIPDLFNAEYAYPYGTSLPAAAGNEQTIKNESFLCAFTNSHNSSTGHSVTKRIIYNAIGTKIFESAITWEPITAMPTAPNHFNRTDETVCYDIALNNAQIEAHFQDHPTQKQIDPTNVSSITYTTTPVISPVDPSTLNTWSNAILHIRGGDAPGDSVTGLTNVKGANTHYPATIAKTSSDLVLRDIGSTKGAYLASNDSQNSFSTGSNLSISGWFKTTDIGTLFSNTGGSATSGIACVITATNIGIAFKDGNHSPIVAMTDVDDGEWHHIVVTKNTSQEFKIYVDGSLKVTSTVSGITDDDLKGNNGFTLLSDGTQNINNSSPADLDSSKLQGSVSNWSLHKEVLDQYAVKQLYSNGHVRNIKNLPSVSATDIEAWWQLNNTTNGGIDVINGKNLEIVDVANVATLNDKAIKASTLTSSALYPTKDFVLNGNLNPFGNDNYMPLLSGALSMSFWLNIPSEGTGTSPWDAMFGFSATDTRNHFKLHNIGTNLSFSFCGGGVGSDYSINYSGKFNAWHHIVMVKQASTSLDLLEVFVDGVRQTITQTYPSNFADPSESSWGVTNTRQNCTEFYLFGNGRRFDNDQEFGSNRTGRVFKLDELAFFTGALTHNTSSASDVATGQVNELWNSGNYKDASSISAVTGVTLQKYFKFGDHSSDVTSSGYGGLKYYDSVNNTAYFEEQDNTNGGTYDLTSSDSFYALAPSTVQNRQIAATGPTLIQNSINGNAMTLSITKNFNFTTNQWVSDASGDAAICLSLNGFEGQAEYFALWKCTQTLGGAAVNVLDGGWHNISLSYRGQNDLSGNNVAEGDTVKFGVGSASNAFNWVLGIDGYPTHTLQSNNIGADYIGGNNVLVTDTYNGISYNCGFAIYNRHLRYIPANTEEQYSPHAQFGAGVNIYATNVTDPNAFRGLVDDTSFHSDSWWVNSDGSNIGLISGSATSKRGNLFNQEKIYTLYGRTTALSNRGAGATYPLGVPYPLLNPELLVSSGNITNIQGTNQFLNPVRKGDTQSWDNQPSTGGLEGWWRWGDTGGDCSLVINDVRDSQETPSAVDFRDIQAVELTDQGTNNNVVVASGQSIYLQSQAAQQGSGSASTQFNQIKLENLSNLIGQAACTVKDFVSPVLQYIRIKLTGSGTCDIGEGKLEIEINHKKRRMK